MSRPAACFRPSLPRYHSLATSTYCRSAAASVPAAGSTTIAPYIPFAMCASTGFVPQWYTKTPGAVALKLKLNDLPGSTSRNATFGAMRAAWQSTECAIGAWFVDCRVAVIPKKTGATAAGQRSL
jgi:hypothetical protein